MHNSVGNSFIKLLRKRETSVETLIKCQGKSLFCRGNVREFGNYWSVRTLDDNSNVVQMMISVFGRVGNIVVKEKC